MAEAKKENEKKKKNPLVFVIAFMLVLILALFGGVIYILLGQKSKTSTVAAATTQVQQLPTTNHTLTDFTVNLADTDQKRYLKITIILAHSSKALETELTTDDNAIRDAINSILRSKVYANVSTVAGTESLKKEIMDRINPLFTNGRVSDVYFTNILVQ
jgi:flagellar FliL protein